jgi:2-polyprenyl-3-methyl-5-hydroxy-6-metoxy-1,4-benzoquinol methylase
MYAPLIRNEADAVFGSRMMKDFGGPLKGGMPLYKYIGNRILTAFENRALGLNLSEFHSGYRAYNVHALSQIKLDNLTNDFHFDTEIIIKLHHQNFRIKEVPIPTFYGDEICYVNGTKYAKAIVRAVYRYTETSRAVHAYPEYAEYFVPYPIKRSLFSCHYYVARLIGKDQRVLEVNSGGSAFASELVRAGNHVVVTGPEAPSSNIAAVCDRWVESDLESGLSRVLVDSPNRYERIVLMDVLEHLKEPCSLLRDCKAVLADRGKLVVSVPNTVNLTVRFSFLFGHFDYRDRGILDWSHVRFFTGRSIQRFLEHNGYKVTSKNYTIMPLERIFPLRAESRLLRFANVLLKGLTAFLPNLFAYEIVLTAEPATSKL